MEEPSTAPKKKVPNPLETKEPKEPKEVEKVPSKPEEEPSTGLKKKLATKDAALKSGSGLKSPKMKPEKAELIEEAPFGQLKKLRVSDALKPSGAAGTFEETKKLLRPVKVGTRCPVASLHPIIFSD